MAALNRIDIKFFSFNDTEEPTLLKEGECQQLVDVILNRDGILKARPIIYKENVNTRKSLGSLFPSTNCRIIFLGFFQNYILQGLFRDNIGHLLVAKWKEGIDWRSEDWQILHIKDENGLTTLYPYGLPVSVVEYNNKLWITNLERKNRRIITFDGRTAKTEILKINNQEITFNFLVSAFNSLFLVRPVWYPNRIYWTYPASEEIGEDNWADIGDDKPITNAIFYQGQFLVFKEDKIYQILGFERALMPDVIMPIANVGCPLGVVANYKNQFLTFLGNDGDIYILEGKQLTNLSRRKIYHYLQRQYIPIERKEVRFLDYNNFSYPGTQELQISEARIEIEKEGFVYYGGDFIRNVEETLTDEYYWNIPDEENYIPGYRRRIDATRYSFIFQPQNSMRLKEIMFTIKPLRPTIITIFLKVYEIKENREEFLFSCSRNIDREGDYWFYFPYNKWDGGWLFKKDKRYRFVLTTDDPNNKIGNVIEIWTCAVRPMVNTHFPEGDYALDGTYEPWYENIGNNWWRIHFIFKLKKAVYRGNQTFNLTFKFLNKCEGFSEWKRLVVKSDNDIELKIIFRNTETQSRLPDRIVELEKDLNKDTIIDLDVPCYYDQMVLRFTLKSWERVGDYNINPSHLCNVTLEWFAPIEIHKALPQVIDGKDGVYYAFVDKDYIDDTKRLKSKYLRTLLRIDEFKNISILNLYTPDVEWENNEINRRKARIELISFAKKDDWIFLVQNIVYTTKQRGLVPFYCPYTHFFNESYKRVSEESIYKNPDFQVPYKIYILSKCIPSFYWNNIKKIFLKGFLTKKAKLVLLPYRTNNDMELYPEDRYGNWIDYVENREKIFYRFELIPYGINPNENPYSYYALQKSFYKVYQLFSHILLKDFCFALKSDDPNFAFFPMITFEYTILPTVLTGIDSIDNQKTERGL